jgi:ribonuclease P protein component
MVDSKNGQIYNIFQQNMKNIAKEISIYSKMHKKVKKAKRTFFVAHSHGSSINRNLIEFDV